MFKRLYSFGNPDTLYIAVANVIKFVKTQSAIKL